MRQLFPLTFKLTPLSQRSDQFAPHCIYYTLFWPALNSRQCMAETLRVKAKQRLGSRAFLSSLSINNTSLCGTTRTDVGKLAIHWLWNTFFGGLQSTSSNSGFYTQQQHPATSENNWSITFSNNRAHLIGLNTYLLCVLFVDPLQGPFAVRNKSCLPPHSMARAHTHYTTDVLFLISVSPKLVNRFIQWLKFSFALLRKALILLLAHIRHRLITGVSSSSHPWKSVLDILSTRRYHHFHVVTEQRNITSLFVYPFSNSQISKERNAAYRSSSISTLSATQATFYSPILPAASRVITWREIPSSYPHPAPYTRASIYP